MSRSLDAKCRTSLCALVSFSHSQFWSPEAGSTPQALSALEHLDPRLAGPRLWAPPDAQAASARAGRKGQQQEGVGHQATRLVRRRFPSVLPAREGGGSACLKPPTPSRAPQRAPGVPDPVTSCSGGAQQTPPLASLPIPATLGVAFWVL